MWAMWGLLGVGFLLNVGAYLHARSMLTFRSASVDDEANLRAGWRRTLRIVLFGIRVPTPIPDQTPADHELSYQIRVIPRDGGGALEAWWISPESPRGVALMYHGYKACKAALLPEAAQFVRMGYACLLVDFKGAVGKAHLSTTIGFREAEDVVLSLHHVRSRQPSLPIVLYGRSMGAAAVLRAVSRFRLEPDFLILESVFDRLLSTVRVRFRLLGLPPFPGAQLLTFWGGVQMGYWGFGHNPEDYARDVTRPTLMLHGADDPKAPSEQGRAVFDNLAGPKTFNLFPGVGHESCFTRRPDQWREAVGHFLGV